MYIRNGIKSNLRAKGRTALFSFLILLLTFAVILALGVLVYCRSAISACDRIYRSVARVEYMGAEYPDADEPDSFAREAAAAIDDTALESIKGVKYWCRDNRVMSYVDGYKRRGMDMPYRNRGVIVLSGFIPMYGKADVDYYTATLSKSFYSYEGKEGVYVNLLMDGLDFVPQAQKAYVFHGTFVELKAGGPTNGMRIFQICDFDHSDARPWMEYNSDEPLPEAFAEAVERYRTINNYVETVYSPDPEDLWPFHQGLLYLEEGRMPEAGETDAVVVSGDMAEVMGLSVGDAIQSTAFSAAEDNRYDLTLTDRQEALRVVGITNQLDAYLGHMWRLGKSGDGPLFGYTVGTAALENRRAEKAAEAIQKLMPDNVRVTLLDQGFADAVEPYETLQSTALNVLIACGIGMIAVLLLFAFLFVGRQSETVRILVSLGTPKWGIIVWLLSGIVLITGLSAAIGGTLAALLLPQIYRLIQLLADEMRDTRLAFSEMLLGNMKEPGISVSVSIWPIVLAILGILLLAIIFCLIFLRTAYQGGTLHKGKSRVRVPRGKTSVAWRGGLRFALLSIRRGGLRTLVVPMVSAVLTILIIVLCTIYQGWQADLRNALDNTHMEGQVTSADGQYFSDLVVTVPTVRQIMKLDDVGEVYVSQRWHYWLPSEMPAFANSSFGKEHREDWIGIQPELVAANALQGAKEYYFTEPSVTWLEGWDESCLSSKIRAEQESSAGPLIPAVVSERFLTDHGWELGNEFTCLCKYEDGERILMLQTVGCYKQTGNRAHIYVPIDFYLDPELVFGEEEIRRPEGSKYTWSSEDYRNYNILNSTFTTCRFTLTSARNLDATRQTLSDAGFGWPGHLGTNRVTILLRDASFVKLTENLGRYLIMGKVMMGMILLIVPLLGFIISWLLINGRKREFAIMRGFGARRGRVFHSFFLEQALLCIFGCLLGCLALLKFQIYDSMMFRIALCAYLVFYLAGCAISVKKIGKTNLMELLAARE